MDGTTQAMGRKTLEAQWLDADEQRAWRQYLHASRLLEAVLDRDLQAHGLQLPEYEIIAVLSEAPERRLRMSAIAEQVVQSRSRLTHTAGRLEKRGWVRREAYVADRRGVELVLTDAGLAAVVEMAPTHVHSVRANLVDPLPREEFLALGQTMETVGRCIEKD
jgi:DNA-binding MarR family transcriptional regulator